MNKSLILWQAHEGNISGANIALLEYIDALQADYSFHIILPHKGSMCKALKDRSVDYTIIPQYAWVGFQYLTFKKKLIFVLRSYVAVKHTRKLINHLRPALVFTNTLAPFVAAKSAFAEAVPHVWWIHEFGEEDFGFSIGFGSEGEAYQKMEKWSKLIICNSNAVAAKYKRLLPGVNVQVNYQPVSWHKSLYAEASTKKGRFLLFGQITASKGHLEVIEAMAINKVQNKQHSTLHIIGPCENETYYRMLLEKIEETHLHDQVKVERGFFVKEQVLPLFEVLIVASNSEAFGRVIVEAGKAGLRVIVKNSGGAPELVNGSNGLLYNTKEELAAMLAGDVLLPADAIVQQYNEAKELLQIKELLHKIV